MMKKSLLYLLLALSGGAFAQTPLPYYSGFDTNLEKLGWINQRTGFAGIYTWGYASVTAYSAPNKLTHDYQVGGSATDTVIDWYVSPPFDFSAGGKLSVKIDVYSIMGSATPADYFGAYLLVGSANPNLATDTIELANFTDKVSSSGNWNDSNNIVIPATPGTSYIAFKYKATNNWWVMNVDNVNISGNPTGIAPELLNSTRIYPNPANEVLHVECFQALAEHASIELINLTGQTVLSREEAFKAGNNSVSLDVTEIPKGIYLLNIRTESGLSSQKIIIQ